MSPVKNKMIAGAKGTNPTLGFRLLGKVRSTDKITMIIQDNAETFATWLHNNRKEFKDKRVEVTIRIIG